MSSAAPPAAAPSLCEQPIFVVGPPRSGTGTLQWALRQHPELWGAEESDYLVELVDALRAGYRHGTGAGAAQWLGRLGVDWDEYAAAFGRGLNALYSSRSGGRRWVEQTDRYVHHLDDIAALFPAAVYLVMERDGRAAVDAMRRLGAAHEEACRTWRAATEAGAAWLAGAGAPAHAVRYEDLIAEPDPTLRGVFRFLGLEPAAESARYVARRAPRTAMPGRPVWWAWTAAERSTFHDVAGDLLIAMGYTDDAAWVEAPASEPDQARRRGATSAGSGAGEPSSV